MNDVTELLKEENIIFEDDKVFVAIPEKPAVAGHVIVTPKNKIPIVEAVPDDVFAHMSMIANKLSIALFEGLQAGGTNIILCNGLPAGQKAAQVLMHVIPRRQDDQLPLDWEPKQLGQEQLNELEQKIKEEAKSVGEIKKEKKVVVLKEGVEKIKEEDEEINYLIRQLQRIP